MQDRVVREALGAAARASLGVAVKVPPLPPGLRNGGKGSRKKGELAELQTKPNAKPLGLF